jgi:PBP1b-binding outer membrane lipoprotein LpoB
MKTKLIIAAIAAFFIAGCEMTEAEKAEARKINVETITSRIKETHMTLSDGRKITCLVYDGYYAGGLSCDWHNTQQPK